MKSRSNMIRRFSAMSLAELLEGNGRAAALASAPASTSSNVIGKGSAAGCRWMVASSEVRIWAWTSTNPGARAFSARESPSGMNSSTNT